MLYNVNVLKLKSEMVLNGYTATSLAKKMNVARNTLSSVLNGKNSPSYEVMCSIISILNIDTQKASEIFFDPKLTR